MQLTPNRKNKQVMLFLVLIMVLTAITLLFGLAWPNWVSQAGPTLPPVDAATATPTPAANKPSKTKDQPAIAYIELDAPKAAGQWSVVQWQDSAGNWHDVEGWRGLVSATGTRRWAVMAKDFNTGPFRWVVRSGLSEEIIGASQSFNLPAEANGTIQIVIQ